MNDLEFLSAIRRRCGSPTVDEVPPPQIQEYATDALEWLAEELGYVVRTDEQSLPATAGQQEYPLPSDFLMMLWVEWNGSKLLPYSTFEWERNGVIWRNAPSGTPTQYAIQARALILYPPPDASAAALGRSFAYRYLGATPGVQPGGTPYLGDGDQWLAVYKAAALWCVNHPSDENAARAQAYAGEVAARLPRARKRAQEPIQDHNPQFRVWTSRTGAAR